MPINKVELEEYVCDNPRCGRTFVPIGGAKQPGITGSLVVTFGPKPVRVKFWAHTINCIGPAGRAVLKSVEEESKNGS